MKRKDRVIENCRDIESVLKDYNTGILDLSDAKEMLYRAFTEERAEGYRAGFSKQKQLKR